MGAFKRAIFRGVLFLQSRRPGTTPSPLRSSTQIAAFFKEQETRNDTLPYSLQVAGVGGGWQRRCGGAADSDTRA